LVTKKHCTFFNNKKDIRATIFQKISDWAQREDLTGWVRAETAISPESANELAHLLIENRELREMLNNLQGKTEDSFDDIIMEIVTEPGSGPSKAEQFAYLERRATALRIKVVDADIETKPQLRRQIAVTWKKQLEVSPFQRSSHDYAQLYEKIISELERLRDVTDYPK
jgi:hypothetical protein